nr:hypothetical protein GCM10020092_013080 [Actinoplanes digitatis]
MVNVRFLNEAARISSLSGLPDRAASCSLAAFCAPAVVGLDVLDRGEVAYQQLLHRLRVLLQELLLDDQVGGDELTVRPQGLLVDEQLALGLDDHPAQVGLRDPGAVDRALRERLERRRVVLRQDGDVAAALLVGVEAVRLQPGAQRDVLGVAELRGGDLLALEVGRGVDALLDDQAGAAGGAARDDLQRGAL